MLRALLAMLVMAGFGLVGCVAWIIHTYQPPWLGCSGADIATPPAAVQFTATQLLRRYPELSQVGDFLPADSSRTAWRAGRSFEPMILQSIWRVEFSDSSNAVYAFMTFTRCGMVFDYGRT